MKFAIRKVYAKMLRCENIDDCLDKIYKGSGKFDLLFAPTDEIINVDIQDNERELKINLYQEGSYGEKRAKIIKIKNPAKFIRNPLFVEFYLNDIIDYKVYIDSNSLKEAIKEALSYILNQ